LIFLSEAKAETYCPWLFTENRDLPLDSVIISHYTSDGKESEKVLFKDLHEKTEFKTTEII